MKNKLIIIGASGHGKVVAEIAERVNYYQDIYFIDDNYSAASFHKYNVLGDSNRMEEFKDFADFFVAIGNNETRKTKYQYLIEEKYSIATLIDPNAVVSTSAEIDRGTVVMPGVIINASTKIGVGCIINTKASIDHDCRIEDFSHVSPGVVIAGTVKIGESVWIGANATVVNNVRINRNTIVGAGAVVLSDILISGVYAGVPIKRIKEIK